MLSDSVSKAQYLTGGGEAFETAYFIQEMDKFFDCFNVSSYTAGKKSRKPFQQPCRSANDFWLTVCSDYSIMHCILNMLFSNQFLRELILDYWQKTVNDRSESENDDKKHMVLSSITDKEIRMTGQC